MAHAVHRKRTASLDLPATSDMGVTIPISGGLLPSDSARFSPAPRCRSYRIADWLFIDDPDGRRQHDRAVPAQADGITLNRFEPLAVKKLDGL